MSLPHRIVKRAGRSGYYTTWFDRATHQQQWRKLAETMPTARRAIALLQEQLTTGALIVGTPDPASTLEAFYRRHYRRDYLAGGNACSWPGKQRLHFENYIIPEFGPQRLDRITLYHAEHWYTELQRSLSRRYANHIAATLCTMLRRAIAGGFVRQGHSREALISRLADWHRKPNIRRTPATLTRAEVAAIAAALAGPQRLLFILWIHTGLRLGEMQWLQWGDIDLRRRVLHVRAKDGHAIKDGEDRTVPLHETVIEALAADPRTESGTSADWFYTSPRDPRRRHGDVSDHIVRMLRAAGKPGASAQTLRHTFASMLLSSGCPLAELQKYMGHSSIQTTERHYAAFLPPDTAALHRVDFGMKRGVIATIPVGGSK
jgi:integrase